MTKMNTLSIIALMLIFLGGLGAILLTIGQSISSSVDKNEIISTTKNENKNLKEDITELRKERNELSETLAKRDQVLQERNDIIIGLNYKLSEKSEYIQNYLTGGKGYPVVDVKTLATNNFNELYGMFYVRIVSKYPVYNLDVNIVDYDKLSNSLKKVTYSKNPVLSVTDFNNSKIITHKIDELSPTQSRFFDKKIKLTEARYFIQLLARNDVYIEKMASLIDGTILYYGWQVYTLDGKLLEKGFGENAPLHVQTKLTEKLNSIPTKINFDLTE